MKISIIMQVYLGEYPGSRKDSNQKFLRAVQSFVDQTDKENELILVSDGCMIAHDLYYKHYRDNPRVRYVYVDKDTPNMYEGKQRYYRGLPRQVGRSMVNGEITTYMDSDDYLLPNAIEILKRVWFNNIDDDWLINQSWYDNEYRKNNLIPKEELVFENPKNESVISIEGLHGKWYAVKGVPQSIPMQPWVLSHKSNCATQWRDTEGGPSEDVDFNIRLREIYKKGKVYSIPLYVRCHYSGRWDY